MQIILELKLSMVYQEVRIFILIETNKLWTSNYWTIEQVTFNAKISENKNLAFIKLKLIHLSRFVCLNQILNK